MWPGWHAASSSSGLGVCYSQTAFSLICPGVAVTYSQDPPNSRAGILFSPTGLCPPKSDRENGGTVATWGPSLEMSSKPESPCPRLMKEGRGPEQVAWIKQSYGLRDAHTNSSFAFRKTTCTCMPYLRSPKPGPQTPLGCLTQATWRAQGPHEASSQTHEL